MTSDADIANKVYRQTVNAFNVLQVKSGKPIVRSNGVEEWTVLAGICAVKSSHKNSPIEVTPLALATGVKCLPDKVRQYSHGSIVHDSHAEILVLRLFNWFLLKECTRLESEYLIKQSNGTFKWKNEDYKLALYISEPPCGDASTLYLALKTNSKENWIKDEVQEQEDNDDASFEPKRKKPKVVRGRFGFGDLGIIRSKPGRSDSIPTASKSCSDKLCVKQVVGITNALTSKLIPEGVFLDYLILREFDETDIQRCFDLRLSCSKKKLIQVLKCDDEKELYQFYKQEGRQPSNLSLLHVVPYNATEVLNNGVKNGSYIKNKRPKPSGESMACNKQLYRIFEAVTKNNDSYDTYIQIKESNKERQELKKETRNSLGTWIATSPDDFSTV